MSDSHSSTSALLCYCNLRGTFSGATQSGTWQIRHAAIRF